MATISLAELTTAQNIGGTDWVLLRDATNTIAMRNGTAGQTLRLYNTYTSGSVYERGFMRWTSNVLEIGTEHLGASLRALRIIGTGLTVGNPSSGAGDAAAGNLHVQADCRIGNAANYLFIGAGNINVANSGHLKIQNGAQNLTIGAASDAGGKLNVEGNVFPTVDDTYYLGKNDDDTPKAWKGLILKDQTTGTYYRLQIDSGSVALVDLTD